MQTDVGLIPMEWSVARLDAHCLIKTGSRNTQDRVEGGAYPFYVRSQQVERINSYSYDGEAVLTAGDGVGTGKVFHYINGKFDVHQRVYRVSDFSSRLHGRYFFYQFSTRFYDRIMSMTAKSSVDSVRMEMIAGMQIPLPPIHEQSAIAAALDDIDSLLSSLDQLIAKKRDIQQATMQQLLTGQRRLSGFNGEWAVKRLGDIASLNRINVVPYTTPDKIFTHFSLPAFDEGKNPVKESGATIGSNKFSVPVDAILVSKLNPRIPRIWLPQHIPTNAVASTEFLVLTPRDGVTRQFLYVACKSPGFCAQMELAATGTTGSHQRISPKNALDLLVNMPCEKSEQTAIAIVISDMETVLSALEARRDKACQLKQGMMQELLTGRIRLVGGNIL